MRVMRVVVAAVIAVFLGAFGLAALGQFRRAALWLGGMVLACLLTAWVHPWIGMVGVPVAVFGLWIDTFVHAYRPDSRLRILTPWPWLLIVISIVIALGLRIFVVEAFRSPSSSMCPTIRVGDHFCIDKLGPRWHPYERGDVIVHVYPCNPERDYVKRIVALGGDTVEMRCHVLYVNGQAVPDTLAQDGTHCVYEDQDEYQPGGWQTHTCSRYHETLGGHTYGILDAPTRPQQANEPGEKDFPRPETPPPSCVEAPPEGVAAIEVPAGKLVPAPGGSGAGPCAPQLQYVVPEGTVFVLGDNRDNSNDSRVFGAVPLSLIKGRATWVWLAGHHSHVGRIR